MESEARSSPWKVYHYLVATDYGRPRFPEGSPRLQFCAMIASEASRLRPSVQVASCVRLVTILCSTPIELPKTCLPAQKIRHSALLRFRPTLYGRWVSDSGPTNRRRRVSSDIAGADRVRMPKKQHLLRPRQATPVRERSTRSWTCPNVQVTVKRRRFARCRRRCQC